MAIDDALAALAARTAAAPYCARLGVVIEALSPDRARLRIPYKDENSNPGRALHGGVAASTIDIAGVLAAWSGRAAPAPATGTLDLAVDYLAAAIGEDIVAEARVLRRGKEIVYADVNVQNDAGKWIAKGLVTHRLLDRAPSSEVRQRVARAESPRGEGDGVPPLARAIVTVPFMARLGLEITRMSDGHAIVRMPATPEKADEAGAVHEGAVAALADTAGAMASWSVVGLDLRYKASTVGIHVSFHVPAREDLVAEAWTWRRDDEVFLNQVTVSESLSRRVVATAAVTYRIVVP
jgi:uncharacterized protein (TIGR00369 family)